MQTQIDNTEYKLEEDFLKDKEPALVPRDPDQATSACPLDGGCS